MGSDSINTMDKTTEDNLKREDGGMIRGRMFEVTRVLTREGVLQQAGTLINDMSSRTIDLRTLVPRLKTCLSPEGYCVLPREVKEKVSLYCCAFYRDFLDQLPADAEEDQLCRQYTELVAEPSPAAILNDLMPLLGMLPSVDNKPLRKAMHKQVIHIKDSAGWLAAREAHYKESAATNDRLGESLKRTADKLEALEQQAQKRIRGSGPDLLNPMKAAMTAIPAGNPAAKDLFKALTDILDNEEAAQLRGWWFDHQLARRSIRNTTSDST